MGCGISKYGLLADQMAPLRKKLEEFRRTDHNTADDNPSTKLLLKDGGGEDSYTSRKSISSIPLEQKESMKMGGCDSAVKGKGVEGGENEGERKNKEVVAVERRDINHSTDNADIEEDDDDDDEEEEEEEEEEEGRISDYDASALWIGSPSFREYCNYDSHLEDSVDNDGNNDGEKKQTKAKEDKSHASPQPNEGAEKKPKRKGRKGKRFRKVFPAGRTSSVKNLFNLTACYNPNHVSASHHKVGKPVEKTV